MSASQNTNNVSVSREAPLAMQGTRDTVLCIGWRVAPDNRTLPTTVYRVWQHGVLETEVRCVVLATAAGFRS